MPSSFTVRWIRALRSLLGATLMALLVVRPGFADSEVLPGSGPSELDWRWLVTQGGITVALLAVLWFYRRDLLRQRSDEEARTKFERDRGDSLQRALERNSNALTEQALAVRGNTDSTHRLARGVEKLDERLERMEHR